MRGPVVTKWFGVRRFLWREYLERTAGYLTAVLTVRTPAERFAARAKMAITAGRIAEDYDAARRADEASRRADEAARRADEAARRAGQNHTSHRSAA